MKTSKDDDSERHGLLVILDFVKNSKEKIDVVIKPWFDDDVVNFTSDTLEDCENFINLSIELEKNKDIAKEEKDLTHVVILKRTGHLSDPTTKKHIKSVSSAFIIQNMIRSMSRNIAKSAYEGNQEPMTIFENFPIKDRN